MNIQVNKDQVTALHNSPLPQDTPTELAGLLPVDILGGAGGIRTLYLLTASQTLSQLSYSPSNLVNIAKEAKKLKLETQAQPL